MDCSSVQAVFGSVVHRKHSQTNSFRGFLRGNVHCGLPGEGNTFVHAGIPTVSRNLLHATAAGVQTSLLLDLQRKFERLTTTTSEDYCITARVEE